MQHAITAVVDMDDRRVILAVSFDQLAVRREGDLITAEIVDVQPTRDNPHHG